MSAELKRICGFLKAGEPELRCAAARILVALEANDDDVVAALAKAGADDNGMVRQYAVDSLKSLAKPKHVDLILPLLDGPMRDKVLPLVKELGGNPLSALKKGLDDPAKRLHSVNSIASLGGRSAYEALLKETSDEDVEYVKTVTNLLRGLIDTLKDEDRDKAYESARKALDGAKERVHKVALVRVLGYLRNPDAADALAKLTAAAEHPSIRSHAIHAIAMLNFGPKKVGATLLKTLVGLLDDKDTQNIVGPALQALEHIPLPDTLDVGPLLAHPSGQVRVLGVKQLTTRADKDSGHKLIELLEDRDEDVKDAAMHALRHEPKFAAMLATFMEKEGKGSRVDLFASILKGYQTGLPKSEVSKFLDKGLELFEKDGQGNWALEVAKSASPDEYKKALLETGSKHKKGKRYELAERFLGLLVREGGGDPEARYELAVTRLRLSAKPDDKNARNTSYPLAMLKDLAKADLKGLWKQLKNEPALTSADYLFAGLYFIEQEGLTDFGEDLLKLVVKEGKGKEAAAAKAAIKAHASVEK
ncbi:MAG: hypothetical protein FD180_3929 [Planctomycetota bacterium]|nr:MAG: hypothetical protein FD180_3929 [Planctomycetota bacterium]